MSDTNRVPPEEVRHIADLARIDLDEEEVAAFAEQFAQILSHFEALDDVPETEARSDHSNVMREDEPRECLSQTEALKNAAETEDGHFKGPRVS